MLVKTNRESNRGPGSLTDPRTTSLLTRTKQHCLIGIRGTVRRSTDSWFALHCRHVLLRRHYRHRCPANEVLHQTHRRHIHFREESLDSVDVARENGLFALIISSTVSNVDVEREKVHHHHHHHHHPCRECPLT
ncbi:hypothetical protein F5888DRAFT_126133 [Russula emetica]|nr:hypothetical protein F5888DRAFT_126133 [Russula emetica]